MKYRIYVIEDDENIRNLICVALENFGYCASGFETAEEALDSLSALPLQSLLRPPLPLDC